MKATIIIPTRSRVETLRYALMSCTSQDYDDLEIIVSDNFSDDDTKEVVCSVEDKRVRYVKTPKRISMRQNFEFALSHVSQGLVGFIGDDDGLMPGAVGRAVCFAKETGLKALTSVFSSYRWPSAPSEIRNTGSFQFCRAGDTERSSFRYISRALRGTGAYYIHDLPSLYYGFADISLLKSPPKQDFFQSITPDAYSAFAVSVQVPSYGYLAKPLFLVGASGRSNGVSHFFNSADKKESLAFSKENDLVFHRDYMDCTSIAVYVHEAFRQVSERYPELAAPYKVDPYDFLRYMSRECSADNRKAFLDAAIHFGNGAGIDESRVREIFSPGRTRVEKLSSSLRKAFLSRIADPIRGDGSERISSVDYEDMLSLGVENCFDACTFFDRELGRIG